MHCGIVQIQVRVCAEVVISFAVDGTVAGPLFAEACNMLIPFLKN